MGCVFLTLSISNMTIGRLGALYEHMSAAGFWTMEAAIAATPKKPPTRETLRVLIRWCLLGIIHAVDLLYRALKWNGR